MTQQTPDRPWTDTGRPPRERAEALVAAMSLEQKIAQLHGNMETIDIYAVTSQARTAEEMDQLATQIRVERHVAADEELGIPRMRVTNGPVGVGMGDGTPLAAGHGAADDDRGGRLLRPGARPRVRRPDRA